MLPVAPSILLKLLLLSEDCHWIEPEDPLKVIVVLLVPLHTDVPPEIVPPTDPGLTVIVTAALVIDGQTLLVTTTR